MCSAIKISLIEQVCVWLIELLDRHREILVEILPAHFSSSGATQIDWGFCLGDFSMGWGALEFASLLALVLRIVEKKARERNLVRSLMGS